MATTSDPHDPNPNPAVASQLHAMGLTAKPLRAAVLAGHHEAARITENDVATRAGYLRWATPLRYLGDAYVRKGFKRIRPGGFEILRSPDGAFEIAVAAGTYATGRPERMPSTRIERGPLTGQAVVGNRDQMRFNARIVPLGGKPLPEQIGPVTWILLHYFDRPANEVRVELSVPVEFSHKSGSDSARGAVTRFEPRLILPPIPLAPVADVEDHDDADDEIDFPVERRR